MVFSDQTFLFVFLPVALLLGLATSRTRLFPLVILLLSLVFFYWSSGLYVLLLLASIAINYAGGLLISRWHRRSLLALVVVVDVAILVYYKYTAFLLGAAGYFASPALHAFADQIVLPIGISFFTFQGLSYLLDVWRGEVAPERNPIVFGAYKAFFPQLIAGPIVRYKDVQGDFHAPQTGLELFSLGVARFMLGLCEKMLIADNVAPLADAAFSMPQTTFAGSWIGALAYTVQIYFDFSGYSDMAIGLALMFGIRFKENFNHPYASATITEFWRRWHISLSSWFRDYLYIPLGGNRGSPARTYLNLIIVFLATGLWHGAEWTFVLWGAWHGLFLIFERMLIRDREAAQRNVPLRLFYFFPVVIFGWVLFRATSIPQFVSFALSMLSPLATGAWTLPDPIVANVAPLSLLALGLGIVAMLAQQLYPPLGALSATPTRRAPHEALRTAFVIAAAIVCMLFVMPQSFIPFLYFRF